MDTATKPPIFPVTGAQLHDIFGGTNTSRCEEVAKLINKYSTEYGIDNAEKMSHFVGQIGAEGGLANDTEDYCYTAENIKTTFGKAKYCDLFVGYESDLSKCVGNKPAPCIPPLASYNASLKIKPEYVCSIKLFDYVYACRNGNGAPNSGEGGRFRGHGFLQLTGKTKYENLTTNWNSTFPNNPKDFVCISPECEANRNLIKTDLDFSMRACLAFWKANNINDLANTLRMGVLKM